MGQLIHGGTVPGIEFDDRVLAHVKVVVFAKFRRNESFAFSWDHTVSGGGGRSSIWLSSSVPIRFVFSGGSSPRLNRDWMELLMAEANGPGGLRIVPEPPEPPTL